MKTFAALLVLSACALAQEPPRPPDRAPLLQEGEPRRRPPQDPEARERAIADLQARIQEAKAALESAPKDAPDRPLKENELRRMEDELRRLRLRPAQHPEPPTPPFPPGAERRRPVSNPEEIRSWLKENEPETYQRLLALQERGHRSEILDMLAAAEGRMAAMNEMKTKDPRGYERLLSIRKLEQETVELAEKARQAPPEERERATGPLREKLSQLFDLREEVRSRELEELKRRVGELEKALEGRKANKERIVENRRRVLLGERPADDW